MGADAGLAPQSARIWAGWSAEGLHFFFDVEDPKVTPPAPDGGDFDGDGIEIYAKGDAMLFGLYGPAIDGGAGALHLIATAPAPDGGVSAGIFYSQAVGSTSVDPPVQGTRTATGYQMYVELPWSELRPSSSAAAAPGQTIALDLALNMARPGLPGRVWQLLLALEAVTMTPCYNGVPAPFCDDRTWCTPKLDAQ
jgi:hypothetical protein